MTTATGQRISPRTIRRARAQTLGYHPVHEIITRTLTPSNKEARLRFASIHMNSNWHHVLFSDEKLFVLLNTGRVALEAFEKGLALDANNAEILDERRKTIAAINSGDAETEEERALRAKRAMEDPEIQAILRDPTINKVLQDMQQNPQSGAAALRDPDIKNKIEKLVAAGVLQVK